MWKLARRFFIHLQTHTCTYVTFVDLPIYAKYIWCAEMVAKSSSLLLEVIQWVYRICHVQIDFNVTATILAMKIKFKRKQPKRITHTLHSIHISWFTTRCAYFHHKFPHYAQRGESFHFELAQFLLINLIESMHGVLLQRLIAVNSTKTKKKVYPPIFQWQRGMCLTWPTLT